MPLMVCLYKAQQILLGLLSTGTASLCWSTLVVCQPVHPPTRAAQLPKHSLCILIHHRRAHSFQLKDLFEPNMSSASIKHN